MRWCLPPTEDAPVAQAVRKLVGFSPEVARRLALAAWDQLPVIEQAALSADWSFWARTKQAAPAGPWVTWGFLTGRGFGKTLSVANFLVGEVVAGRARRLLVLAQDEQSSIDIQVLGPSGLVAVSPPWCKPRWEASAMRLVWPNGAEAHVRTPEVPGKIRGLEYDHAWASELQSWPAATREEAWTAGVISSTRLAPCRVVWDATQKRRHPLLKMLTAQNEADPVRHVVVKGGIAENATNLGPGFVDRMRSSMSTARWREEGLGEELPDADGALFHAAWLDAWRRAMPARFVRRVISVDPAITGGKGSDTTGIVEAALGEDGRVYVIRDESARMAPEKWAPLVLDMHERFLCNYIIAETNKGGSMLATTLRALGQLRGLEVVVVPKGERVPPRQTGKVFVKEVYASGSKADRAEPVAAAYEHGRVSHVVGCNLSSLEDTLTTWEPAPNADSPGDLDALVHAVVDLLDLTNNVPDARKSFVGLPEATRALTQRVQTSQTVITQAITSAFRNRGRPDTI